MTGEVVPLRPTPETPANLAHNAHEQAKAYSKLAEQAEHEAGEAWTAGLYSLAHLEVVPAARRDRYQRLAEFIDRELRDIAFMRMRNPL